MSPNDLQRSKLLLQRPPMIQNIIITSSNDPKINTINHYAYEYANGLPYSALGNKGDPI